MKKLKVKHWQDPVVALLGAWFAASPWLLQLEHSVPVVAASLALGLALVLMALGSLFAPRRWERWSEAALGLAVAVSPWLAGFADDSVGSGNAVTVGLVAALLALWSMAREGDLPGFRRRGMAH
jgi:hypothetical protein